MKHRSITKLLATAAVAAGATLFAAPAHADQSVNWGKVLVEADRFVRTGAVQEASQPKPIAKQQQLTLSDDPAQGNLGNAWFGVAPKVTLVARDWASSTRLAGERLSLVDGYRLSQSTRMIVTRMRLNNARFTPFVQVGLGQWRVDTKYMPLLPQTMEVASQLGTGIEIRVSRRWQLAAEISATTLIREGQNEKLPQNVLWSSFIASRITF